MNWWKWLTTSRYTRTLEAEVARLREENRQLLNSLLLSQGLPSMDRPIVGLPRIQPRPLPWNRQRQKLERQDALKAHKESTS